MRATFIALFLLTACGGEKTADKPETTPTATTQPSDPSPAARAAAAGGTEAKVEVKPEPKPEAKLPNGLTKAELAEKRKKINQRVEEMTSRVSKSAQPGSSR